MDEEKKKELSRLSKEDFKELVIAWLDLNNPSLDYRGELLKEVVKEYAVYNSYYDIHRSWIISPEDEHLFTDEGLEVPYDLPAIKSDRNMYSLLWKIMLIEHDIEDWHKGKADTHTNEEQYYKAIRTYIQDNKNKGEQK